MADMQDSKKRANRNKNKRKKLSDNLDQELLVQKEEEEKAKWRSYHQATGLTTDYSDKLVHFIHVS